MKIIEIKNLKKYYGNQKGIENVNFDVEKGKIYGFIGPNGAGKSTTIRILMGLLKQTSGSFKIDLGYDQQKYILKEIGYVASEVFLYPQFRVEELLKFNADIRNYDHIKNIEMASFFGLDLSKKIKELSHGNKKKVAIVCALAFDPKLIILDEPTSGLDPIVQNKFYGLLRERAKKGVTILFSSHNLFEIRNICDKVAIIKDGKIIKKGDISSLNKAQFKKVVIETDEKVNLDIDNQVINFIKQNSTYRFDYLGNINKLIFNIKDLKLKNLQINDPSLEEVFMHYYKEIK